MPADQVEPSALGELIGAGRARSLVAGLRVMPALREAARQQRFEVGLGAGRRIPRGALDPDRQLSRGGMVDRFRHGCVVIAQFG